MSTGQRVSDKPQFNQSYRSSCIRLCLLMVCIDGALTLFISTKITKLLNKLTKEKGNEDLQPWVKPCERHLYWSATSTQDGNGKVIWAKFKSFLSHIINRHTDLDDPLFNKCAHRDIPDRKWIDPGIVFDYSCYMYLIRFSLKIAWLNYTNFAEMLKG